MKSDAELGQRLRAWRQALGLTQAQMAERLGLHIGVLKKYETGQNTPGGEALAAYARTGVNMNWLLTGDGEMFHRKAEPKPETSQEQAFAGFLPPDHPHARRWAALIQLVEEEPDEARRDSILSDLLTRAQEAAELAQLRRVVQALAKKSSAA